MPPSYAFDRAASVVTLTFDDTPIATWRMTMLRVMAHPSFVPHISFLVDLRATSLAPSAAEVRDVVAFLSRHRERIGESRWAVVVDKPARFGMARTASALANGPGLRLRGFRDLDEARLWLLPPAERQRSTKQAGSRRRPSRAQLVAK